MLGEIIGRVAQAREIRRALKLNRADFEAWKLEKFRRLARHVRERSPYYRRIIEERKIDVDRCQPSDFPVLTKSLLMQNFDEISTAPGVTKQAIAEFLTRSHDPTELFLGKYRVIHTSGSSGEVGYFVYSPQGLASRHVLGTARSAAAAQAQRQIQDRLLRRDRRPLRGRHDDRVDQ